MLSLCTPLSLLQESMSVIGFVPEEISMVLELLSAILNLGNIDFVPCQLEGGSEGCRRKDNESERCQTK